MTLQRRDAALQSSWKTISAVVTFFDHDDDGVESRFLQ